MIILDSPLKSLELVLGSTPTAEMSWASSYVGLSTLTFVPASDDGLTTGTTPVTIVPAPVGGKQHQLKHLSVINTDSVARLFIVQLNDSGNARPVCRVTLDPGDTLSYIDTHGFMVNTASGAAKLSSPNITIVTSASLPPVYFSYATPSPMTLVNIVENQVIESVEIALTDAFDAPFTLSVGTVLTPGLVFSSVSLTTNQSLLNEEAYLITTPEVLRLIINPGLSTQGAGYVLVTLRGP